MLRCARHDMGCGFGDAVGLRLGERLDASLSMTRQTIAPICERTGCIPSIGARRELGALPSRQLARMLRFLFLFLCVLRVSA